MYNYGSKIYTSAAAFNSNGGGVIVTSEEDDLNVLYYLRVFSFVSGKFSRVWHDITLGTNTNCLSLGLVSADDEVAELRFSLLCDSGMLYLTVPL